MIAYEAFECDQQLFRGPIALGALFAQAAVDDANERRGSLGTQLVKRRRRLGANLFRQRVQRVFGKRLAPAEHLIEHDPERKLVRAPIQPLTENLLGLI